MSGERTGDWPAFIAANTRVMSPPLVPEIRLHLAEESLPIWQRTEEDLGAMNVPPPYWAFAWAGGQALARHLIDNADLVRGRHVLDIGAGSGLGALAAALAGAAGVVAQDIDEVALRAIELNARLNALMVATTAADVLRDGLPPADVVLVGDLFYERPLADMVLRAIEQAAAGGALVLAGDPRRSYFPAARFVAVAEYRVPVTRELEDTEIKHTAVWRLGRPG